MATKAIAPWQRSKLAEVAEVRTGIAKNNEKALTDPVELPYLRVANVQDGHLDLTEIKTIAVESSRVERYSLEDGDVLMTEGGDFDKLGRGAVWRNQISPCLHQNHVFAVRVNRKHLLPEFLAAYCAAEPGRRYFLACSKQTTNLASINSSQLKALPLRLPSLDEQRRIVRVLDAADRQIDLAEKIAKETADQSAAIASKLIASIAGKQVDLAQVVSRVRRPPTNADVVPLTISAESGLVPQSTFFGRRVASDVIDSYTLIRRGEFAYNKSYSNGYPYGAIKRLEDVEEGVLSSLYLCFGADDQDALDGNYLAAVCESGFFNRQIHMIAHEGARNHGLLNVSAEDFFSMRLPLPNQQEQKRIADAVRAARARVQPSRERVESLQRQKRALMQKLLTGQQRLTRDLPGMEPGDV
ncbi:restriction endonuclease subunit S [Thermomonas sp.]|uniref:restriction endonuclease subunit S n=1 Tax=Thermomonas sp. TaxID=1971895 RepID=UPI0035B2D7D9